MLSSALILSVTMRARAIPVHAAYLLTFVILYGDSGWLPGLFIQGMASFFALIIGAADIRDGGRRGV
jgi:hypothetical protein